MKRNAHFIVPEKDFKLLKVSNPAVMWILFGVIFFSGSRLSDLLYVQHPPSQAHLLSCVWRAEFLHTSL